MWIHRDSDLDGDLPGSWQLQCLHFSYDEVPECCAGRRDVRVFGALYLGAADLNLLGGVGRESTPIGARGWLSTIRAFHTRTSILSNVSATKPTRGEMIFEEYAIPKEPGNKGED